MVCGASVGGRVTCEDVGAIGENVPAIARFQIQAMART